MRKWLVLPLLAAACVTPPPPQPAPPPPPAAEPQVIGLTYDEEARILGLEDRREYDAALAAAWLANPNPLHRARMALVLGRIGPHTFIDANNNGERDADEHQAGAAALAALVTDPDRNVRETVAFALGEIGDPISVEPLFRLAADADAAVAAEAAEALSKLATSVPVSRFAALTAAAEPEGVRARAVRYLFRWNNDEASALAASLLDSPVRQAAAYALARRAYAPARERLELLAADPDVLTRAYVAQTLGRIGARESLPTVVAMLRDEAPWVRTNAVVALGRMHAVIDRPELGQDALHVIELTDDSDPGTRASAIDTLGWYAAKNAAAQKRLEEIFANGSRWERELATGALVRNNPEALRTMKDLTPWQRVRAIEALPPAADALRASFATDADPMVRASAITSIPDDRVDANVAVIRAALDDPDVIVRTNAIDRYMHVKDADPAVFRAAEERARRDAQDDARLAAITAITDEAFLRSLLKDNDSVVRRTAADLIEQKLKKPRPQYTPLPVTRDDYLQIVQWSRQPHTATIRMTRGNIQIALLTQDAPITAWNFAQLAQKHFFDNTTFMRVVPNFVIQGGDPRNDMNGGPGYAIRDEINLQKYTRAAVGMALSGPDTGGSQFFITHSPQPHLDGGYTIFGRVTEGMNAVVDQTERGDRVETIVIDGGAAK
jgi:cyclophilin family peptidyl-prolyl cis-trans isomerase/HEAT repeat protein